MLIRTWLAVAVANLASLASALAQAPASPAAAQAAPQAEAKPTTGKVGEKIPAFTGKVTRGGDKGAGGADFDSTKTGKTTVYLLVGITCPASRPYAERLCVLEAAYMPKGVDFVYLYVNSVGEPTASKQKFHKEMKFAGAFLDDTGSAIAKKLAATKTGEALIVDKEGKVLYRGGIDDNMSDPAKVKVKYVATALEEILAGKPVTKTSGTGFGCPVKM